MDLYIQIIVVACLTGMTSLLAHRSAAVFHDGIRPILPQLIEGYMNRREAGSIAFGLSIGFVASVGISFTLKTGLLNAWLLFLPTDITLNEFNTHPTAFICTNIQETDLAGHAEDVARYAERLQVVDRNLARLVEAMQPDDCLVVMADHGNDPTIGHSHHTREVVPVLVYQQGMIATQLGVRTTLSDVGATVCEFFRAPPPQNGRSFLSSLRFAGDTL